MMKRIAMTLVLAAAACGGGSKKAPETTTTAPVEATAVTALTLGELKLVDVNKNRALLIHADGTIEVDGQKPAKVTADGKIVRVDNGEVGFTLEADGSVKGPGGADIGAKVNADGSLAIDGKTISLDDKGMLIGGNPEGPPLKVEGATDVGLKRTAMFVLVAMLSGAEKSEATAAPAP